MGSKTRHDGNEHFAKLPRELLSIPAWRALSPAAQALYPFLKLEWKGPKANNNGKIRLSVRQAARCLGCCNTTAAKGFHELQAKGFIVVTEGAHLGTEGMGRSTAYELTELRLPGTEGPEGRKLYKQWLPGQDFSVKKTMANNPTGRKKSPS